MKDTVINKKKFPQEHVPEPCLCLVAPHNTLYYWTLSKILQDLFGEYLEVWVGNLAFPLALE